MILETIAVAFAMFSAIPVPQPVWNEKNMRYALCAFPLVGVVCGMAWVLWTFIAESLSAPLLLRAAGFCLLPVWITGGIHLDGYADTCDALASYGDFEKRQKILKDPHCGAFAVIRLCSYFAAWFALCGVFQPEKEALLCMGIAFVLSRTLSALAIASLPLAKDTGLAHTFQSVADRKSVRKFLVILTGLLVVCLFCFGRMTGAAMALTAAAVFGYYEHISKKEFGGISGDLAGWFLQKAEIWMLAAMVACQLMEEMI